MSTRRMGRFRSANHHIYRIDTEERGRHCWVVVIQRRGRRVNQLFYDAVHPGGRKGALAAARAWRDAVLEGAPDDDRPAQLRLVVRRNSKSGIPGVIRYEPKKEKRSACWIARWEEPGVGQRTRRFSVMLHGEDGAFEQALEARRSALERLGYIDEGAAMTSAPRVSVDDAGRRQPELIPPDLRVAPADAIAALKGRSKRTRS